MRILAAYLALSSIAAIVAFVQARASPSLLAVHLLGLATAVLVIMATPRLPLAACRLPLAPLATLAAIPFLYAELPHLLLSSQLHDPIVQRWEASLFGASPAQTAAAHWPSPVVSEVLHAAYLSYYVIVYGPPLLLFLRGEQELFERTVAVLMATFAVCFIAFIIFPVAGPRYLWPAPKGIFNGPVRRLTLWLLAAGSSKGTAFPSSHVAVSTVQTLTAFRWSPRVGAVLAVLTMLLAAGAVYGGFHYGIDVLAGAALGLLIAAVYPFSNRAPLKNRWYGSTVVR